MYYGLSEATKEISGTRHTGHIFDHVIQRLIALPKPDSRIPAALERLHALVSDGAPASQAGIDRLTSWLEEAPYYKPLAWCGLLGASLPNSTLHEHAWQQTRSILDAAGSLTPDSDALLRATYCLERTSQFNPSEATYIAGIVGHVLQSKKNLEYQNDASHDTFIGKAIEVVSRSDPERAALLFLEHATHLIAQNRLLVLPSFYSVIERVSGSPAREALPNQAKDLIRKQSSPTHCLDKEGAIFSQLAAAVWGIDRPYERTASNMLPALFVRLAVSNHPQNELLSPEPLETALLAALGQGQLPADDLGAAIELVMRHAQDPIKFLNEAFDHANPHEAGVLLSYTPLDRLEIDDSAFYERVSRLHVRMSRPAKDRLLEAFEALRLSAAGPAAELLASLGGTNIFSRRWQTEWLIRTEIAEWGKSPSLTEVVQQATPAEERQVAEILWELRHELDQGFLTALASTETVPTLTRFAAGIASVASGSDHVELGDPLLSLARTLAERPGHHQSLTMMAYRVALERPHFARDLLSEGLNSLPEGFPLTNLIQRITASLSS